MNVCLAFNIADGKVLIDTWWNVNIPSSSSLKVFARVLIDTWWNVNAMNTTKYNKFSICFNRYMVECELFW